MLRISVHGYSIEEQAEVQAMLLQLVVDRHGWILEEHRLSATAYRLRFEVGLFDIVEVYGALQQTGLQFTPSTHRALSEMCLCQKHLTEDEEVQIVTVDLQVTKAEDEALRLQRFRRPYPS
ncbi:MAG: hypothetical protein ACYDC6_07855 [Acidobacteriaceae bacterium]